MTDPVTLGLLLTVLLILGVVIALLFRSTPTRRAAPKGAAAAFHQLLLGDRIAARSILTRAIQAGDAPPEAFLRLGDLLREDGEPARALSLHQGILARPRLDPDLRRMTELSIADDLLAMNRSEDAQRRLARLDKHFVDDALLQRRALALHRLGRIEDAAAVLLQRARLLKPDGARDAARYLAEMGREALREGRLDTADRLGRRALRCDTSCGAAYAVLGDVHLQQHRLKSAIATWQKGIRAAPDAGRALLPRLLELSHRSGQMESLLGDLEELRANRPQDPVLWRAVSDLRLRRGDLEAFFSLVEDPPDPEAADLSTWAGWIRHLSANGDSAALRRLLSRMPDSFGPRAWVCTMCGAVDGEPRQACARCGHLQDLIALGESGVAAVPQGAQVVASAPAALPGARPRGLPAPTERS
jgi:tetratricopeptide (TPR) repeat protein